MSMYGYTYKGDISFLFMSQIISYVLRAPPNFRMKAGVSGLQKFIHLNVNNFLSPDSLCIHCRRVVVVVREVHT